MSTHLIQTPGLHPKEYTLHQQHGESLKTECLLLYSHSPQLSDPTSLDAAFLLNMSHESSSILSLIINPHPANVENMVSS
jgi:hypothetical protein